jgi:hypothetical protein
MIERAIHALWPSDSHEVLAWQIRSDALIDVVVSTRRRPSTLMFQVDDIDGSLAAAGKQRQVDDVQASCEVVRVRATFHDPHTCVVAPVSPSHPASRAPRFALRRTSRRGADAGQVSGLIRHTVAVTRCRPHLRIVGFEVPTPTPTRA